jgi:ABC-type branched-subunit amino acid transport system ATPase component/ABC-type branched-subunit amino acid transport system permease subunit
LRTTLVAAAGLVVVASVLAAALNQRDAIRVGQALGLGTIMLSLVLLTGYSGQVSLCQMTFAGLGAYAMAHAGAGGNPVGLLAAAGLGAAVGALVALPAIRLEGLYLALATMAFALLMDNAFFLRGWVFGQGAAAVVDRVSIFGLSLTSDRSYVVLLAVAFAATAVLVLALRRSGFGRRLAAMKDSPTACTTLGLDLTATKLLVFSISAGIASVGGALLGGMNQRAGADQFAMFQSLQLLLQVVIGGIASVGGALFGGALNSSFSFVSEHLPKYGAIPFLITGLAGIILGSSPQGIVPRLASEGRRLLGSVRRTGLGPRGELPFRGHHPAQPHETGLAPRPLASGSSAIRGEAGSNGQASPLLELRAVRAAYGRIEVLHGIDLVVPRGKIVAVLGPNGAGKTTALKCVAGHLVPTAGSIRVAGRRVNGAAPDALARAGVCSVREMRGTFPNLTVDDNLRMVSHLAPVDEVRERAYARFPWLGDRRNQMAGTLSGGEQQMLAMARAVATDPGLLLLDEISMGLAPKIVRELYDVVGTLAADGTTVLVVEQFAQTVLKVADSAVLLVQGAVSCAGTADEVEAALVEGYLGVAS